MNRFPLFRYNRFKRGHDNFIGLFRIDLLVQEYGFSREIAERKLFYRTAQRAEIRAKGRCKFGMKDKTVHILLAAYSGERYIEDQIGSLMNQTTDNWKLLVRDDCSHDNTVRIIEEYRRNHPEKIVFLGTDAHNRGVKNNFNFLLQASDSDYCMLCDQDDVWLPDKLEVTLSRMIAQEERYGRETPILVHTDMTVVDAGLKPRHRSFVKYQNINPIRGSAFNRLLVQNVVTGCTVMINRALKELVLPIPESAVVHDWWMALAASAMGVIDYLGTPTVLYRQHDDNVIGARISGFRSLAHIHNALHRTKKAISSSIVQSQAFFSRYGTKLGKRNAEVCEAFGNLSRDSFIKKRYQLVKYGFSMCGLIRNMRMFVSL